MTLNNRLQQVERRAFGSDLAAAGTPAALWAFMLRWDAARVIGGVVHLHPDLADLAEVRAFAGHMAGALGYRMADDDHP